MARFDKIGGLVELWFNAGSQPRDDQSDPKSSFDVLAEAILADPGKWATDHQAIYQQGVFITWNGPLDARITSITVKLDDEVYSVPPADTVALKAAINQVLRRKRAP